ncbi:MAG TPA: hypothetical protein VIM70_10715 [Clostridium sp.]|uniref:hypothetical protein n=1 Tax=Clostridium sp. TaxID=1506 RepID=UPI002F93D8AE
MKTNRDIKLKMFLYEYMDKNKIMNKSKISKKENIIDMDVNFKEKLKQRFKTLALLDETNQTKCSL